MKKTILLILIISFHNLFPNCPPEAAQDNQELLYDQVYLQFPNNHVYRQAVAKENLLNPLADEISKDESFNEIIFQLHDPIPENQQRNKTEEIRRLVRNKGIKNNINYLTIRWGN